jgi:hypothetical protein
VCKIGTDKFVVGNEKYAQVGTISGTVVSLGSQAQITASTTGSASTFYDIKSPATDVFVVRVQYSTQTWNAVAATVSGTTISAGTTLEQVDSGYGGNIMCVSPTEIWITSGYGATAKNIHKFSLSGNTLTYVSLLWSYLPFTQHGQTWSLGSANMYMLDDGKWIMIDPGIDSTNHEVVSQGMCLNNYIGFAQNSGNTGDTITVRINGVSTYATGGLVAGQYYGIIDSGLTQIRMDYPTTGYFHTLTSVKAVSATQVIV